MFSSIYYDGSSTQMIIKQLLNISEKTLLFGYIEFFFKAVPFVNLTCLDKRNLSPPAGYAAYKQWAFCFFDWLTRESTLPLF